MFNTTIPGEYAFLFTNESPGTRTVTFGLHTGEKAKPYRISEYEMDEEGNLEEKEKENDDDDEEFWRDIEEDF